MTEFFSGIVSAIAMYNSLNLLSGSVSATAMYITLNLLSEQASGSEVQLHYPSPISHR